jgi:hypothetical protein
MRRLWLLGAAFALTIAGAPALAGSQALAAAAPAQHAGRGAHRSPVALLVCNDSTVPCPAQASGTPLYQTVQAAVDAAHPGDWVLIWPGVYHEKSAEWPTAGVWIQKNDIHIRGLNRNQVIIDGSNGSAKHPCPSSSSLQDTNGGAGRNGIVVYKSSGDTIQNLTVCDYLAGSGGHGNEIWWNGGDGSGVIGMGAYSGSYLSATSMYGPADIHSPNLAQYGIFVSNASGPGRIDRSYASNMADAAYYVGACQQQCNTVLVRDIGTNSALGYSGTNAGGRLIIKDSVFTRNRTGLAPNSLNNDDAPPPQNGLCPGSTTQSCLVISRNVIADNNNANVPTSGLTPAVGTGVEISGGAYDTVRNNVIINQGAWGVVTHDYPDPETPPAGSNCQGGVQVAPTLCIFPAHGNLVYGNLFSRDGGFGNPTNGDVATVGLLQNSATPRNCFYDNHTTSGALTSEPKNIESAKVDGKPCGKAGTSIDSAMVTQLICATGDTALGPCPKQYHYPQQTKISLVPLPTLPTMPDPCSGVPKNGFCTSRS